MTKIGYVSSSGKSDDLRQNIQWMRDFGCVEIVEEEETNEALRPRWKLLLSNLGFGDTLVVSKLSNAVRGARELSVFLELCRVQNIRLISINDRIDSRGEFFPETRNSDILNVIATLPAEAAALRSKSASKRKVIKKKKPEVITKDKRNKRVVNMYKSNYSIDDIWKASGFRSRSSIFRILKDEGIKLRNKRKV